MSTASGNQISALSQMESKILALWIVRVFCGLDSSLLLSVVVVDLCDIGIITIEDPCDLFESWALGLNVEEVHEDKLDSDPNLFLH